MDANENTKGKGCQVIAGLGALEGGNERQSHGLRLHRHLDSDGNPCDLLCSHVPVELVPARRVRDCGNSPRRGSGHYSFVTDHLKQIQPETATRS